VNQRDGGAIVALVGAFAVWTARTDVMLRFLRPAMRPWLLAAGVTLLVVGVVVAVGTRGRPAEHSHRHTRVGWLLALPLCVAVIVRPDALGSYSASRSFSPAQLRDLPDVDVAAVLRAADVTRQSPELSLKDFLAASRSADDRDVLAEHAVRLTGFVTPAPSGHHFFLTRFMINCCAVDGVPLQVDVRDVPRPLPDADTWVRADGVFDEGASAPRHGVYPTPVLRLRHLEQVDEPDEPYLTPF
jgi:uncharacterized repeat protein (TIGR03943 family)